MDFVVVLLGEGLWARLGRGVLGAIEVLGPGGGGS